MTDAFIYDHVRTPRGRGKADGSLHEVTALNLATQALGAIKDRNKLDPALVDDVVLGCVDPVGEAGGDIARAAALTAGYGDTRRRACRSTASAPPGSMRSISPSAAGDVRPARHDHRRRRRIDEPRRHRRLGRRLADGSGDRDPDLLHAAGHLGRPDRDQIRLLARRRRRLCGREPEARRGSSWDDGHFKNSVVPVKDVERHHHPRQGRAHASDHDDAVARRSCSPSFVQMGEMGGFDAVAIQAHPEVESGQSRASRRQFVRHRRRRGRRADRQQGGRHGGRPEAARAHPGVRQYRLGARASCSPARST